MEKWTVWILLEATTVFIATFLFLMWRIHALKRTPLTPSNQEEHIDKSTDTPSTNEDESEAISPYRLFASKLDAQANDTADRLAMLRDSDDLRAVTELKLWGTLVKAERAIVLNDASQNPQTILNRFMANIIQSLEVVQAKNLNKHTISKNLEDLDAEFIQASEILISKESLLENQKALHEQLRENIDRADKKLKKLGVKTIELERLIHELETLKSHIKTLEQSNDQSFEITSPSKAEIEQHNHHAARHLHKLQRLSERQQAIIDQLQAQLVDNQTNPTEREEVSHLALKRMERMAAESNSLIGQLQAELESANLSINSLKDEIHSKDTQLKELDEKIKAAEGNGALDGFLALHSDKQTTLESIIGNLSSIKNTSPESDSTLSKQEKEVKNLEHMLKESETCVQLLAQELDSAEKANENLREQVETKMREKALESDEANPLKELEKLRESNRDLVSKVSKIKESLLSQVSESAEKDLRNTYNKKSLELDRLQLAYSDLERKYLGTLR